MSHKHRHHPREKEVREKTTPTADESFLRSMWELARAGVLGYVANTLYILGGPFRRAWGRMKRWVRARNFRYLLCALPALLVLTAAAVFGCMVLWNPHTRRLERYQLAALSAYNDKDFTRAALAYQRVVFADDSFHEGRLRWAVAADAIGETDRATGLLATLAPRGETGYPRAHLYQGQRLLREGWVVPDQFQAAEEHLRRFLDAEPESPESYTAHAMIGQVYQALGNLPKAIGHLERAVQGRPELNLPLGQLYAAQQRRDQAVLHATRAREHFKKVAEKSPDDVDLRLRWAEATLLLGEAYGAVQILEDGIRRMDAAKNKETVAVFRRALAQTYYAQFDAVERDPKAPGTLGDRLTLLGKALECDPANVEVLIRLHGLGQAKGAEGEAARKLLEKQLVEGKAPALVHLLLGFQFKALGDAAKAGEHFAQAFELQPSLTIAANNLAWSMAHATNPDLPGALKLIDSILAGAPKDPHFRDTRGQILALQGKWKEARVDLEFALTAMADNVQLHETLAKTYGQLGNADLARQHEQRAAELQKEQEAKKKEKAAEKPK